MPEHTIPEALIEQIRSGRAVLVVGAGIGVASWKQVLEKMNEELAQRGEDGDEAACKDVAKLLHKGNLGRAAGFLARSLGEEACDVLVKEAWENPGEIPEVVSAIARLPFKQVWTTFPGGLIEQGMREHLPDEWPLPDVRTYQDAAELKSHRRSLLKILGDFDSYIVTPKSVRRALSRADELREHARTYYADGALVFVGFRFGDPDLAALLDRVFGQFEPPQSNHYLIASGVGPVTVDELMAEHHIEVINLEGKGADEKAVSALLEYLGALRDACAEAKIDLAQATPDADDLDGWLAVLSTDPDNAEAAQALVAIEAQAEEDGLAERLAEVILARVELIDTASERAALLRKLAGVYETQIGDLPGAFTALTAALRVDPADTTAVDEAERLADDTDGWSELVADVSEVAGEIEDQRIAASYWCRLGRWYHQKLNHHDYGVASYREALRLDPENLGAHRGLAELYRVQQRWAELADVLKAHVELESDVEIKLDLYLGLGDLYETQLASTARAMESYQAAVDLDDRNDDALAALERLYKRDERWGKLARVLEQRAELIEELGDGQRAQAIRRELATLRAEKLGDLEGAITKYEAALETDDADVAALKALEDLYEKSGRTDDYLRTLARLAEVSPEGERVIALRRLAAELEEREGGLARAISCYEQLIELEPGAEDSYRHLERLLGADQQWYELVAVLERHIASVKAPTTRVELFLQTAEVFESKLDDPHRAIEGYLNALSIAEDHHESLVALARLYRRTESWDRAVDILVRHAEREHERGADLWFQAGEVASEHMQDHEVALRHFEKAIELEPSHQKAMLGLATLHQRRASWQTSLNYLLAAEPETANRLERIEILARAAELAEDNLDDADQALELRLRMLKLDPEHEDAGVLAGEALVERERWEEALPVLEMLVRKVDESDKLERARREGTLGRTCEALGLREKAAKHYRRSVEADPDSLDAALGLVSILYADAVDRADVDGSAERWQEVDKRYRELLARHRTGLADRQVVDVWYRIGQASRRLGESKKAAGAFRRALERDPQHGATLSALIEVASADGDWKTVVDCKRAQLEDIDDRGKLALLEEMGDLHRSKLNDPVTALGAYLEGLQIQPDSHVLLHKSLEIYTEQKQWRRAIETLDTLASHETDTTRRSKYQYAAAVIGRDELRDVELAVEHFNLSLDDVADTPKAFDAIDKLLTEKGDWKNLARAYRKQLKRIGEDAPAEYLLNLWTRLGDVCLDHLGDNESAIAAYEVATSIDPDDTERHEQLANLYLEAGETRRADAIEELQILVSHAPDRVELYRALSNLYQEEGEDDKAYCVAQALVFLGAANSSEAALFEAAKPTQFTLASRRITEELWQKSIVHQRENRHLNAIFSSLAGSIAATTAQPASAFNLKSSARTDLDRDSSLVGRVFKFSSNILGLDPVPQLYMQPESADGIRVANTTDDGKLIPSVLVGNPQASKREERELAFEVGKRLAYMRPERYVNYALQTLPKLESAVLAALVAAGTLDEPVNGEASKLVVHLKKTVPKPVLEQVGAVGEKIKPSVKNGLVAGWRTAADLTANRVGLILCNDLETAARMVATEGGGVSTLATKDRLRDLIAYSVSEGYFAVRRHLGITVRDEA